MKFRRSPVGSGGLMPETAFRIDYRSDVDGREDWAIVNPGERADLWFVVIHGHGSHGDQLYTRQDIRKIWLPEFQRYRCGILTPNLRDNAWMGPAAAADTRALLNYLRKEQGGKIFLFVSGSMGGTSNLIYAALHPEDVSGVIARGAATDLATYYRWCRQQSAPILKEIADAIASSYGGTPEEAPELYARHSALLNADRLTMPLYFAHGGADATIPVSEARALVEKMTGKPTFRYLEIPGGGHDSPLYDTEGLVWLTRQPGITIPDKD